MEYTSYLFIISPFLSNIDIHATVAIETDTKMLTPYDPNHKTAKPQFQHSKPKGWQPERGKQNVLFFFLKKKRPLNPGSNTVDSKLLSWCSKLTVWTCVS